jgi:hypothetical protein
MVLVSSGEFWWGSDESDGFDGSHWVRRLWWVLVGWTGSDGLKALVSSGGFWQVLVGSGVSW